MQEKPVRANRQGQEKEVFPSHVSVTSAFSVVSLKSARYQQFPTLLCFKTLHVHLEAQNRSISAETH